MDLRSTRIKPSRQQQMILDAVFVRLIIEANAGAGKTTTAALLVRKQLVGATDPHKILILTYTEPGCHAVKQALLRVGVPSAAVSQRFSRLRW